MDPIIDFLIYLAFFAAGYFYRYFLFVNQLSKALRKSAKAKDTDNVIDIELTLDPLTHEIINNENYFYSVVDKSFVCQAYDLDQAAKKYLAVKSSYSIGWFVHCENNKKYCFANGEVQEVTNE